MPKNSSGTEIEVGMTVDRLDNYKQNGKVLVINRTRGRLPILVRWPILQDEWCSPELLVPKSAEP